MPKQRFRNLRGRKFGKLKVIAYAGTDRNRSLANGEDSSKEGNGRCRWLVGCECGKQKLVFASNLLSGRTRSCGCAARKSGDSKLKRTIQKVIRLERLEAEIEKLRADPDIKDWSGAAEKLLCKSVEFPGFE